MVLFVYDCYDNTITDIRIIVCILHGVDLECFFMFIIVYPVFHYIVICVF